MALSTLLKRNMCKTPTSPPPPPLVNNLFILNCREKAKLFTDFFSQAQANGSDEISGEMLLLCDDSVSLS